MVNNMLMVGSSMAIGGNASGFSKSQIVSPISKPSTPMMAQISPEDTDSTFLRPRPSNVFNSLIFDFTRDDSFCDFSEPKDYLYEPFSSVMKTGNFNKIANDFNLGKLHQHSHLYTNDDLIDFPGRRFKIESIIPYQKKEMKAVFENQKYNITIRNFPISVEELRKKWKIKDGGSKFAFFTTDFQNEKIVLICNKI